MDTKKIEKWSITEELAIREYEMIIKALKPGEWKINISGHDEPITKKKFMEMAKTMFQEGRVYDLLPHFFEILDSLDVQFDIIRKRLEESFRSMLITKSEMYEKIEAVNREIEDVKSENSILKSKEEVLNYDEIFSLARIKVNSIVSMFTDLQKTSADIKKMSDFNILFNTEVDNAKLFLETKKKKMEEMNEKWKNLQKNN